MTATSTGVTLWPPSKRELSQDSGTYFCLIKVGARPSRDQAATLRPGLLPFRGDCVRDIGGCRSPR
jgi:hypothetical protein